MRLSERGAVVANEMWEQIKDENPETDDLVMLWLDRVLACPELWTDEPGFVDAMRSHSGRASGDPGGDAQ